MSKKCTFAKLVSTRLGSTLFFIVVWTILMLGIQSAWHPAQSWTATLIGQAIGSVVAGGLWFLLWPRFSRKS